jgi:hypothetical protein
MRPANDLDYMPSNMKAEMRKELVRLKAVRASLTVRGHIPLDKQIRELKAEIDRLDK